MASFDEGDIGRDCDAPVVVRGSVVARNAGLMSGQYAVPCLAWNAACAAYSVLA